MPLPTVMTSCTLTRSNGWPDTTSDWQTCRCRQTTTSIETSSEFAMTKRLKKLARRSTILKIWLRVSFALKYRAKLEVSFCFLSDQTISWLKLKLTFLLPHDNGDGFVPRGSEALGMNSQRARWIEKRELGMIVIIVVCWLVAVAFLPCTNITISSVWLN